MSASAPTSSPPGASTEPTASRPQVNVVVFAGSAIGIIIVATWAILEPQQAADTIGVVVVGITEWFGWFYIALATVVVVFVLVMGFSRYGNVRLGPDDSRPEFSTFSWAAMLFAAGIGTDLMFFSVAEPVTQYLAPPRGQGGTLAAANEATVLTLFHYGISGWAMYALMGMALGYFAYRRHLPLAVRSSLYPIFGKRLEGGLGNAVDTAAVLGTIFGVATSLGIGVVQLNFGLSLLFGVPEGTAAQVALVVVAVVMASVSATTGVDKGIRLLSQINVLLAIGLAGWVLIAGKTAFLLDSIVMNVGDFVSSFPGLTAQTYAYDQPSEWMGGWTLFFWAWWIAWASFVGMFLARISKGRTIRQFVVGTMVIPFSYIVMWVSIFGNSAIDKVRSGDTAFGELAMNTPERGFYTLLLDYPGAIFITGVATLVGLLFYVTSADSGALVMANLSSRLPTPKDDGSAWLRIVWAAVTGLLTIAMLLVGGVPALQNATVIMGLPFGFVMLLVMVGLYQALQVESLRADSSRHALPLMLSGRGSAAGEAALASAWRARLGRAIRYASLQEATSYLESTIEPGLREVAEELERIGVPAQVIDSGTIGAVELRTATERQPFLYRVQIDEAPVPAYGGRMVRGRDAYARLQVHLAAGGQDYDVMGYSKAQLIHEVLDRYEDHLAFLRLQEAATS